MPQRTMSSPFEANYEDILANADAYVDAVFESLGSSFLVLPRGPGFIDYATFERGYEALKLATDGFLRIDLEHVLPVTLAQPISLVVLRSILGFTPPEWAYVTAQRTGIKIDQGAVRTLDRSVRLAPEQPLVLKGGVAERLRALVESACALLNEGLPEVAPDRIHRLDKADTAGGRDAIRRLSGMGVPYAMLLYERFLGRPFAGHRDSVSEIVGDVVESAVEDVLSKAGVSYRKTKRAERIDGFDQAPDFIIPSEFNPQVIIEAKLTEDDGTAPRQSHTDSALGRTESTSKARRRSSLRSCGLYCRSRVRRAPRGHEEDAARHARKSVHLEDDGQACSLYPSPRVRHSTVTPKCLDG